MNNFQFSEISVTGQLPEKPDNVTEQEYKAWICAKAISDWGICMMGGTPPANFGYGMVQVDKLLGVLANPTSLQKYADEFLNKGTVSEL